MKILMVCLGNICRSPLAEGIMKAKAEKYKLDIAVDSAGTAAYHVGQAPDIRSQEVAKKYAIDITQQKARKFSKQDFLNFDKIFVMDAHNYSDIISLTDNTEYHKKVDFLLNQSHPDSNKAVPDPYYGGSQGFENVYQMIDKACEIIAIKLEKNSDI